MAERMGAQWLAKIDADEAAGVITPQEAEAKRISARELIRRGRDMHYSLAERAGILVAALFLIFGGVGFTVYLFANGATGVGAWLFAVLGLIFGVLALSRVR